MKLDAGLILPVVFLPGLIYFGNPAFALLIGMTLTLILDRPIVQEYGKYFLQGAIILLGFKLNISELWRINADYTILVGIYVISALCIGLGLARLLKMESISGILMASGTAICGGTTIATLAPILKARADQVGVALAIVFLLNAAALFTFPYIGHFFELTQEQFGVWVALSIHDTSSVVATAQIYGDEAARIATTVKLGRTLWLIPLALMASLYVRSGQASIRLPIFILAFIAASIIGSVIQLPEKLISATSWTSKAMLVVALYLLGSEITRDTLRAIKGKALAQALILWSLVVPTTLFSVIILID
ncbi:MAG: putative integral membrane protein (TIGR00698 family) [Candidatus Azotimanducaceae bacterium]|jgi:uncharacterized integral membrane protein (TIGR00698 family)